MIVRFACLSVEDAEPLVAVWATPADQAHVARRRPAAARDSLAARASLRALLARETGRGTWDLRPALSGKPAAWTLDGVPGPAITLSHSAGMVAVALGAPGTALGIDIERHGSRAHDSIADTVFGPAERGAVRCGGTDAFYRIWTAREARAKATGGGLGDVMLAGDVVGPGVDLGCWRQNGFFFQHQRPLQHYSLTIAADVPLPPIPGVALA